MVLRDYIQDEKDFNEDMQRGVAPGTTKRERDDWEARQTKMRAERDARISARLQEILVANPDIDPERARWLAEGYSEDFVDRLMEKPKPETEAQRLKREAKERRDNERYWEDQRRKQDREAKRLDRGGYFAGLDAGDKVGLDQQLDADKRRLE